MVIFLLNDNRWVTMLYWEQINSKLDMSGWFILLTSILGFWRVKRWERGIMASQRESPVSTIDAQGDVASRMHDAFSLRGVAWPGFFRRGFGLGGSTDGSNDTARTPSRAEEGLASHDDARETDSMLPHSAADPESNERTVAELVARDRRLRADLRAAGFM